MFKNKDMAKYPIRVLFMNELNSEQELQINQLMENLERAKLTWVAAVTKIDLDLLCENAERMKFYIENDELVNPKYGKGLGQLELETRKISEKDSSKNQKALKNRLSRLDQILTIRSWVSFILGIFSLTNYVVLFLMFILAFVGAISGFGTVVSETLTDIYSLTILHGIILGATTAKERKKAKSGLIMNVIALASVLVIRIWLIVNYILG